MLILLHNNIAYFVLDRFRIRISTRRPANLTDCRITVPPANAAHFSILY
jgi:hypothetical protein